MDTNKLIMPNPELLARDIFSNGFRSCAAVDAAGWVVTQHEGLRKAVDQVLERLWSEAVAS